MAIHTITSRNFLKAIPLEKSTHNVFDHNERDSYQGYIFLPYIFMLMNNSYKQSNAFMENKEEIKPLDTSFVIVLMHGIILFQMKE
jgi:hypothetical protein